MLRPSGWRNAALALLLVGGSQALALPTQSEALALAFPSASIRRIEHFLTDEQGEKVKSLSGAELRNRFVVAYEAKKDGVLVGVAFFDGHVVRTLPETVMVAISPEGTVRRMEVICFREPQSYQAPAGWTNQFHGKALDDRLSLKRDIRPLSGASLTASALTDAARRALALWQLFYSRPNAA